MCIPVSAIKIRASSLGNPQTAGVGWREDKMSNWKTKKRKQGNLVIDRSSDRAGDEISHGWTVWNIQHLRTHYISMESSSSQRREWSKQCKYRADKVKIKIEINQSSYHEENLIMKQSWDQYSPHHPHFSIVLTIGHINVEFWGVSELLSLVQLELNCIWPEQ